MKYLFHKRGQVRETAQIIMFGIQGNPNSNYTGVEITCARDYKIPDPTVAKAFGSIVDKIRGKRADSPPAKPTAQKL